MLLANTATVARGTVPTAHRRFTEWTKASLWPRLHRTVLDAASIRAKKGFMTGRIRSTAASPETLGHGDPGRNPAAANPARCTPTRPTITPTCGTASVTAASSSVSPAKTSSPAKKLGEPLGIERSTAATVTRHEKLSHETRSEPRRALDSAHKTARSIPVENHPPPHGSPRTRPRATVPLLTHTDMGI